MLRNVLLRMAASPFWISQIEWWGRRSGLTRRFVAGESLEEALPIVRSLHDEGLLTTLDQLGEDTRDLSAARRAADKYIELLRRLNVEALPSTLSVKLSQLGLAFDTSLCRELLGSILAEAEKVDNFVTVDMESSAYTESTLEIYRWALDRFGIARVGIVLQAYLFRTEADLRALSALGCHIRLCKGAYREPRTVAFPLKSDVNRNYRKLVRVLFESPSYPEVATHDERLIRYVQRLARERKPRDSWEFQMLFGIRRSRQRSLARAGYRVRVYVPFGTQWAPYFTRRLAERPANLMFLLRHLGRR